MAKNKMILVANWKMNPDTMAEAKIIAETTKKSIKNKKNIELVVCPPFIFLQEISNMFSNMKNLHIGAQDVYGGETKSVAGEVGLDMLAGSKVKYALVGHSSRRDMCESDEVIAEKVANVIKSRMTPILCIGEETRNETGEFYIFVKNQLEKSLSKIKKIQLKNIIIAYEPVWAIGKKDSEAMKADDLHEMTIFIRKVLSDKFGTKDITSIPILYGGSVSKKNINDLVKDSGVQGFLVGRESLNIQNFSLVIDSVNNIN